MGTAIQSECGADVGSDDSTLRNGVAVSNVGKERLTSIQALRAIAAIVVVAFHALQSDVPLLRFGDRGVDLFFVISGFIMVHVTRSASIGVGRFVADRVIRIVPMYWLATLVAFGLALAGKVMWGATSDPGILLQSLLFIPHYNADGHIWPLVFLGWTLNFEAFFYALFAVALTAPSHLRTLLLGGMLVSFVAVGAFWQPDGPVLRTYTSPLLLEFLAGAIIAEIYHRFPQQHRAAWAWLVLLTCTMTLLVPLFPRISVGWLAVILVGGGVLLDRTRTIVSARWIATLGDASYSIYLFQQFFFTLTAWLSVRVLRVTGWDIPAWLPHLFDALVAVLFGVFVHFFLERPVTRRLRALFRKHPHQPAPMKQGPQAA
ncbi:MAG: acyltransferase [Novosphingobium sp.]